MDRAMNDLIERIKAQLDADEFLAQEAARAVADRTYAPASLDEKAKLTVSWQAKTWLFHKIVFVNDPGWDPKVTDTVWAQVADHIARHDPARTLAMVAAHRKILDVHGELKSATPGTVSGCVTCDADGVVYEDSWPCPTVLALAEAYGITA
jgi:hypothetical protein